MNQPHPRTRGGRVTEEHLAELEEWAGRYPRPWTVGVGSYVLAALVAEVREARATGDADVDTDDNDNETE
jgi:hypothetical protein